MIEYAILSDATMEGYELGKGPWSEAEAILRGSFPQPALRSLLVEDGFDPRYAERIASEVVAFAAAHPDWKIRNDCADDYDVVTDEERSRLIAEGADPNDPLCPMYRKVGSRYRRGMNP